jgi:hypothetical protein
MEAIRAAQRGVSTVALPGGRFFAA